MAESTPNRKKMLRQAYFMGVVALVMAGFGAYLVSAGALPNQFNLVMGQKAPGLVPAEGYEVRVFQTNLAAPRYLLGHPSENVLFVAERGAGRVIALQDTDDNHEADEIIVVAENLANPTGMDWHDGWLYVAQAGEVTRLRLDENWQVVERQTIIENLPVGRNENEVESNQHGLVIHEDELYLSIGASCLFCTESDSRRGTVMVYALDGSNERAFARGLYNALGLDVNPITQQVWASNQGRPKMDPPAAETIYALQNGDDAGWPNCLEGDRPAPEFEGTEACQNALTPLLAFNPQGNITMLHFLQNEAFAGDYTGDLLFVLHGGAIGSGRRDAQQVDFAVYRLPLDAQGQIEGEPEFFVDGFWLSGEPGDFIGRPFGLGMLPNGVLYLSDDASGAVLEVRRTTRDG
jgi:glucose/arabinose dehydrogenase